MTKKISKEIRQRIHCLNSQGMSVKELLSVLGSDNVIISEKSIYRILKENKEDNVNNRTFQSFNEEELMTFAESDKTEADKTEKKVIDVFDEFDESVVEENKTDLEQDTEKTDKEKKVETLQETIEIIKSAVKEETQKVLSSINQDIIESNDKLDIIMKEAKKNCNKPMNMSKTKTRTIMFNIDGLTEQEKNIRRDLIVKIRNYVDCFSGYEIIDEICGDKTSFKQSLYERDTQTLNAIYEEIQIGLNQSKDYEQFMQLFSTSLKAMEFVSNVLLGLNLTGLRDDVLNEIDEFDLRQLACELSLSRYISPQKRIMLITLNAVLKKIISSSNLLSLNNEIKGKLYSYYQKINSYLKR